MTDSNVISFRLATASDADKLAALAGAAFREAYHQVWETEGLDQYIKEYFTATCLHDELQQPTATFILLYHRVEIIGYAKLNRQPNPPELADTRAIRIQRLYLRAAYYGQGAGNQLMQQCLDIARQEGYEVVWLAVWPENTRAVRFYERWGFTVSGAYPFHTGSEEVQDWLMSKKLT